MVKVEKSKYIRTCLTLLIAGALIFSTLFVYFLGWDFKWDTFGICIGIIIAEMIGLITLYFVLVKTNKNYYLVTNDVIKMFNSNQEVLAIPSGNIVKIHYVRFAWAMLMQMGAGYLHIEYTDGTEQIKPTVSFPSGKKIYAISMSLKKAKEISNVLGKDLEIK